MAILEELNHHPNISYYIGLIFIVIGIVLFFKREKTDLETKDRTNNYFKQGFFIALLNPQAIPFWIIVIGFYDMQQWLHLGNDQKSLCMMIFVFGALFGKFCSLYIYSLISHILRELLSVVSKYMSRITGVVLVLIGVSQFIPGLI